MTCSIRDIMGQRGGVLRETLYNYCLEYGREELTSQWHTVKNVPLTPESVTYGSKKKVWWHCDRGHEWRAAVYTRTSGHTGCPYCAGKCVSRGETDLLSQNPELAEQWHPTKNNGLTPDCVAPQSHRRVWWLCEKGHEWQAAISSRSSGSGCPVCTRRTIIPGENDLAVTHPELAKQWHPTKNRNVTPQEVVAGTQRKSWWICERGHEWRASIVSRTGNGAGCPVCAGKVIVPGENDLNSAYPELSAQWHPTKNGNLVPQRVSPYSNRKVWWICPQGHEYSAVIATRTERGSGCPYCAGRKVLVGFNDLATVEPEVTKQWHPELNGTLTPGQVTVASHKKVWWQCHEGHVWRAVIYSRTKARSGCPVCAGKVRPDRQARYTSAFTSEFKHGDSRI